jgi:hypothetical protein
MPPPRDVDRFLADLLTAYPNRWPEVAIEFAMLTTDVCETRENLERFLDLAAARIAALSLYVRAKIPDPPKSGARLRRR